MHKRQYIIRLSSLRKSAKPFFYITVQSLLAKLNSDGNGKCRPLHSNRQWGLASSWTPAIGLGHICWATCLAGLAYLINLSIAGYTVHFLGFFGWHRHQDSSADCRAVHGQRTERTGQRRRGGYRLKVSWGAQLPHHAVGVAPPLDLTYDRSAPDLRQIAKLHRWGHTALLFLR